MISFLSRNEWVSLVSKRRPLLFNEQESVVNAIKTYHNCEVQYIVLQKKNKVLISFVALVNKKNILAPIHFFYSAIWVDSNLSDTTYCESVTDFIKQLNQQFNSIKIKLPPNMVDIRPFIWNNYNVDNKFTYLKNIDDLTYGKDVQKGLANFDFKDYEFKNEVLTEASLAVNISIFEEFGDYSRSKINKLKKLIVDLAATNYLTCLNCYKNGNLLVSHILFVDKESKIVYTVLKNKAPAGEKLLHTVLYHQLFSFFKAKDYELVDLLGADMEKISLFKSRFNVILAPVTYLSYNKQRVKLNEVKQFGIACVKRLNAFIR